MMMTAGFTRVRIATFTLNAFHVTATTPVKVTATYQGSTASSTVTVLKGTDTVTITITKAEYTVSQSRFVLNVTSSDVKDAFMLAYNATTGAPLSGGQLLLGSNGQFTGTFTITGALTSVTVQSADGGLATGAVKQK